MRSADPRARTAIALGATLAALAAGGCGRQAARRPAEAAPATTATAATNASRAPVDAPASGDADTARSDAAGTGDAVADQAAAAADAAIAAKAEAERQLEAALLVDEFLGTATPPLIGIGAGGSGGGGSTAATAAGNGPNFPVPQQPPQQLQRPNPYGGIYNNSVPGTGTTTGNGVTGSPTNGTGPLGMQTPTLAISPVPVNTRGEFVIPFTKGTVSKPFESDPAQGGMLLTGAFTGPAGKRWNVPGFWDGTQWKIRFAPDAAGQWSYDFAAQTSAGTDRVTGTFTAAASASPPFLTIERHQFRGSDGSWFRGRGYNAGYQAAETLPFQQLLNNSVNLVSFWMQTPAFASGVGGLPPLENPVGTYIQSTASQLDQIVAHAEAAGMRLLPSIWPHDLLRDDNHWGTPHWQENPYHAITDPVGFFTLTDGPGKDSAQWHAQKNLYRYILARWGTSPAIIGWVAVVEIEGTTAGKQKTLPMPDVVNTWALAMRDAFAAVDPRRVDGGAYPLTISYSSVTTGGDVYDPGLDLLGYDSYEAASGPTSNEAVAAWIGYIEQKFAAHGALGIITEFGADIPPGTTPAEPTQPRHLHNASWAAIGGGATIAPVLWTDGDGSNNHFPLPNDAMQAEWKRLAAFDAELAKDGFDGADLQPTAATDASGAAMALAHNADRGCAWILGTQPGSPATATSPAVPGPPRPLTTSDAVTFPAMHAGTYDVTWFDAAARSPAADVPKQIVLAADGALVVPVPTEFAGKPDAAVIVVRQGAPSSNG